MRVTSVRFVGAAGAPGQEPSLGLPEVAIGGRSNVGKSSLINALLGRRGVARTSRTPGRTRQVNFFLVNEAFVIADLPGYGFAVGSEAERLAWGPLVETYLRGRQTLRGMVVLVDVRRGIEHDEHELLEFLTAVGRSAAVVATKLDKLGRGPARAALAAVARELGPDVPVLGFSARTGDGRVELWRILGEWLRP